MTHNYYIVANSNEDIWLFDEEPERVCFNGEIGIDILDDELNNELNNTNNNLNSEDSSDSIDILKGGGYWFSSGKSYCLYTNKYGASDILEFLNIPIKYISCANWFINPIEIILDIELSESSKEIIDNIVKK